MSINNKLVKLFAGLIFFTYVLSFSILFWLRPDLLFEVEYIGLTSFNVKGMQYGNYISILNYGLLGCCITLFGIILSRKERHITALKVGSTFIIISGIAWAALSFPMEVKDIFSANHLLIIAISWGAGILGVFLIAMDLNPNKQISYLKGFSISIAVLMLAESLYFIIFDYYSGIVSAISWSLYISWFCIFGIFFKEKVNKTNNL